MAITQGALLLIVRRDQADVSTAAWPEGVQVIVDRRQAERRVKNNPRVAIQRRHGDRRQRGWVDRGAPGAGGDAGAGVAA